MVVSSAGRKNEGRVKKKWRSGVLMHFHRAGCIGTVFVTRALVFKNETVGVIASITRAGLVVRKFRSF
jgi:hypothetical protein